MRLPPPLTHSRLAAWADNRLLPSLLACLLAVDVGVGLNWLLSPASDLTGAAYDVAKLLQPMNTWGALFLAAGSAASAAFIVGGRGPAGYVVLLPAGLWALWTVLFGWAASGPGSSWLGAIFAGLLWVLHLLAGLAATHEHLTTAAPATVRG